MKNLAFIFFVLAFFSVNVYSDTLSVMKKKAPSIYTTFSNYSSSATSNVLRLWIKAGLNGYPPQAAFDYWCKMYATLKKDPSNSHVTCDILDDMRKKNGIPPTNTSIVTPPANTSIVTPPTNTSTFNTGKDCYEHDLDLSKVKGRILTLLKGSGL